MTRDRIMASWTRPTRSTQFKVHKGYCTPLHQEQLDAHGPSATHRMRFINVPPNG